MHAREPASFWRENVVAVVTLLRVLARMSKWQKQVIYPDQMLVVLSFCDARNGEVDKEGLFGL